MEEDKILKKGKGGQLWGGEDKEIRMDWRKVKSLKKGKCNVVQLS